MANQAHLDMLKQGVEVWNQWREEHPDIRPDLRWVDLWRTELDGINLSRASLDRANISQAYLRNANLAEVECTEANLNETKLIGANLSRANLGAADFSRVDFSGANLTEANLAAVNLNGAYLGQADLSLARVFLTVLGDVDLSVVKGLETVQHAGPSTIGIDTIIRSQGKIPEIFLRQAGVPNSIIEAIPSLVGSLNPIDFYSCFISYSSQDQAFAQRLFADLQSRGVRCWFAPEDLKIGDRIRPRIDESIRLYDKLLLVLSQHSVASQWVEQEVETALAKERKENGTVLFPIRLDKTVMNIEGGWPALIRNTRNIGDFTRWKRHDTYQQALERLLRDLKAESSKLGT